MLGRAITAVALCLAPAPAQNNCQGPADLTAAVAARPSEESHSALGFWFAERGNAACAIPSFRAAVALNARSVQARYNLGIALLESGDDKGAVLHLEEAVRLAPSEPNATRALAAARERLATRPVSPIALAARKVRAGDFAGAAEAYRQYLVTKPDDAAAHTNLGVLYQQQGRTADAERHFRLALEIAPTDPAAYLNLGLTLISQSRFAESEAVLRKARDLAPNHPRILAALGMTISRQQRHQDALAVFRRALELEPNSAVAHLNAGIALADLSLKEQALTEFDQALRLEPRLAEAHYNRGRALHELRRFEEARASLEQAIALRANHAPALMMLGMAESSLGHPEKAIEHLQRSIALGWSDTAAHFRLGKALLDTGRPEEGITHLKKATQLDPANSQAVFVLMRAIAARNPEQAAAYGRQLRDLKAESMAASRARVLSNFALEDAKKEDWPKATERLREAIEVCGECVVRALLHKNLGLILAQSNDNQAAVAQLSIAHNLDPQDKDIEYALTLLRKRLTGPAPASPQ